MNSSRIQKIVPLLGFLAIVLFLSPRALADTMSNCQPIFGGGPSCMQAANLSIDKKIQNPQTNAFVDNLGANDAKFSAEQTVVFQLTVKNTSNAKIDKITVKDTYPQFVSFVSGNGTFDQQSKTLTFIIDLLQANESKTYNLTGKVVTSQDLPDQAVTCVVNRGIATTGTQTSQDNAGMCIQKQVLGTSNGSGSPTSQTTQTSPTGFQTKGGLANPTPTLPAQTKGGLKVQAPSQPQQQPPTGPEALVLAGLLPLGAFGEWLKKKTNR